MSRLIVLISSLLLFFSTMSFAEQSFTSRKDVKHFINNMVKKHGFNRQELTQIMSQAQLQPKIIESMEMPYEKKNWDFYKSLFITEMRIKQGVDFWQANRNALDRAEKQFGVPASIIVAIIGVETLYGKRQGNYRVLDALSTLAFNYPKRSPYFTRELEQYLLLCKEHNVSPTKYSGSYAGAIGMPQFMPSSYRSYATHFSKNDKVDLTSDNEAVIASVANYLKRHGWTTHQGIAQPAKASAKSVQAFDVNQKKAEYSLTQLKNAGVQPVTAAINSAKKFGIIELSTQIGPEYWLAYPNFYVITRYNSSPQYALAVYLLSQNLKKQYALLDKKRKYAYV